MKVAELHREYGACILPSPRDYSQSLLRVSVLVHLLSHLAYPHTHCCLFQVTWSALRPRNFPSLRPTPTETSTHKLDPQPLSNPNSTRSRTSPPATSSANQMSLSTPICVNSGRTASAPALSSLMKNWSSVMSTSSLSKSVGMALPQKMA